MKEHDDDCDCCNGNEPFDIELRAGGDVYFGEGFTADQSEPIKLELTETTVPHERPRGPRGRIPHAFTLMELLIVILIIGLLVGLSVAAYVGAAEQARANRTRAIISKLDQMISSKWDTYKTRRLPIRTTGMRPKSEPFVDANGNGFWDGGESFTDQAPFNGTYDRGAGYARLMAMRELQRMELPDRNTDVAELSAGSIEVTATGMPQASLQRTYWRKAMVAMGGDPQNSATWGAIANWTPQNQGSECLYLIVSAMQDGDKNGLDFFTPDEIGDTDQDGMREILDGWGRPIGFLRWAPAFTVENVGIVSSQVSSLNNGVPVQPDPFDIIKEDARDTFALRPLLVSGGRDGVIDVAMDFGSSTFRYSQNRNDPYYTPAGPLVPLGTVNIAGNGEWLDNITNQDQTPQP